MKDTDSILLCMLGKSVVAAVHVETAFVIASKLAFGQRHVVNKSDIVPVSKSKDFRVTLGNNLKKLMEKALIDTELADRLKRWNDNRHDIIHLRSGNECIMWGDDDNAKEALTLKCQEFCEESSDIALLLVKSSAAFMMKFPELAPVGQKHLDSIAALAKRKGT